MHRQLARDLRTNSNQGMHSCMEHSNIRANHPVSGTTSHVRSHPVEIGCAVHLSSYHPDSTLGVDTATSTRSALGVTLWMLATKGMTCSQVHHLNTKPDPANSRWRNRRLLHHSPGTVLVPSRLHIELWQRMLAVRGLQHHLARSSEVRLGRVSHSPTQTSSSSFASWTTGRSSKIVRSTWSRFGRKSQPRYEDPRLSKSLR